MKVIKKGKTPDGTKIQIEDWSENYKFYSFGAHLVAYPQNRYGETFRAELYCDSHFVAATEFENLLNGYTKIEDYAFKSMKKGGLYVPYEEMI